MSSSRSQNQNKKIHIALALDRNYVVHVYALLTSIFYNNQKSFFDFHVIATGVTEVEKEELKQFIIKSNSEITFYEVNEEELRKQFYLHSHYSVATYYRLFFPALIPSEITKLLYIDCDTIVIGSLEELYNIDMGNAPLAAATDPILIERPELGIPNPEGYFNAGVMLLNIKNWIDQKVTENALEFLRLYPEKTTFLLEQDALNATLIGKWFKIDNKYNFTWHYKYLQVPTKGLLKDKVIIHYITEHKPWFTLTRNKFRYLYHDYLKMSPKAHEKKYIDFNWSFKHIWGFTRIRIKEFYFDNKIDKVFPIKKWKTPNHEY
jgi:lipopolysaccharide biosynthesis glycosyltransferase